LTTRDGAIGKRYFFSSGTGRIEGGGEDEESEPGVTLLEIL